MSEPGRPATAPHGSRSRYQRGECRCAECRAVNARAIRNWRATGSTFDRPEPDEQPPLR